MENFEKLKDILVDVLGVAPERITPQANLLDDLAAESIDFMDIAFQVEDKFGLSDITPASMFPAFMRDMNEILLDGRLKPDIRARLEKEYPFLTADHYHRLETDNAHKIFFDVSTVLAFIEREMATKAGA